MTPTDKRLQVTDTVKQLTDADLELMEAEAIKQRDHYNPNTRTSNGIINSLGEYNMRLAAAIRNLHDIIKSSPFK